MFDCLTEFTIVKALQAEKVHPGPMRFWLRGENIQVNILAGLISRRLGTQEGDLDVFIAPIFQILASF